MQTSLIICTYQRPKVLLNLLNSVKQQELYPNEIIIVDGSLDDATKNILEKNNFKNLYYFKVDEKNRGLTRQRNFGISKVSDKIEVICFLDDDVILDKSYLKQLLISYNSNDVVGVGGYITNEVKWSKTDGETIKNDSFYCIDGFKRPEALRYKIRKKFGLVDQTKPGFMPSFSHGRSISYLPPSSETYQVEFFMGGVASYKKELFEKISFSTYFEGYGLYEDMDFCLKASEHGKLLVNTSAKLEHHHAEEGRPNKYNYGKMVLRNGWYVWHVKYPNPSLKAKVKWNLINGLLIILRFLNVLTTAKRKEAFTESIGRLVGWLSLLFNKPTIVR